MSASSNTAELDCFKQNPVCSYVTRVDFQVYAHEFYDCQTTITFHSIENRNENQTNDF